MVCGHLGPWELEADQGRGESGQVIVYVEARVVPALWDVGASGQAGARLRAHHPLALCHWWRAMMEGVDEEDLDDLNVWLNDGATHPQAQLATNVG